MSGRHGQQWFASPPQVPPKASQAFWEQLPECETETDNHNSGMSRFQHHIQEYIQKSDGSHRKPEKEKLLGRRAAVDDSSRLLSQRTENTDIHDAMNNLKNDIITTLKAFMQTELDGNLEKLKMWARGILLASMTDETSEVQRRPHKDDIPVQSARVVAEGIGIDLDTFREVQDPQTSCEVQNNSPPTSSEVLGESRRQEEVVKEVRISVSTLENSNESDEAYPKVSASAVRMSLSGAHQDDCSREALEAVSHQPTERLEQLLEEETLNPNLVLGEVTFKNKNYTHCSLLAAAVLCSYPDKVNLLVKMKADPDSEYGFLSGSTKQKWSYPASAAAIAKGDISMLKLLLKLMADPEAEATNGANMIWQCCYFGRDKMLELLVSFDLPVKTLRKTAESQNQSGITHSPLHISVVMGQEHCSRVLLKAKAPINSRNEEMESPLDAAISCCRPEIVTLLVQEGAEIVETGPRRERANSKITTMPKVIGNMMTMVGRKHAKESVLGSEIDPAVPAIERIFDNKEPNPVMVHAVAVGLQSQPEQVAGLTPDHVLQFWETDTRSMIAMLKALFVERHIRFRSKERGMGIVERKTALLWKDQWLKSGNVYRHPLVVSTPIGFAEFNDMDNSGAVPTEKMRRFIKEIAPQRSYSFACGLEIFCKTCVQHTPIIVNECLVTDIHKDLRFLKIIADAGPLDQIYLNGHCQAIITYVWSHSWKVAIKHCLVHFMLLLYFMFLAVAINFRESYWSFMSTDLRDYVQIVSMLLVPCWIFEVMSEFLELVVYVEYGWVLDYWLDTKNILDVCRVTADGVVLLSFLISGLDAAGGLYFRCFTAIVCLFKWTKTLYCFTPFRLVGLPVMPILFTLQDIGSSVAISLVYLSGMAHAVIVLDVLPHHYSFTALNAFFFGIGGDVEKFQKVYHPQHEEPSKNFLLQFIFVVALFAAPVTLMNIFIAAMSSSYGTGIYHMENLYQNRCAEAALHHACNQYATEKFFWRKLTSGDESSQRLWYCCSRERLHDQE